MSSYRTYVPWSKSGLSSSYSGSGSSYGGSKASDSGISSSTSQYDGGGSGSGAYGRRANAGGDSSNTGRSSYLSGSSYRSPYLSSNYSRSSTSSYLSSPKDSQTSNIGATERRDNKESERLSLRDKYSSGTYPGRTKDSSYNSRDKDDVDAGSSHRALGRSISTKSKRDASPERKPKSADVGMKTDRVGYGSSISPYRLYSRSSYSRSTSRDTASDAASSTSSTPTATPVHTPSSLRFGSSSKYGSTTIRSPLSEKPTPIFGHSSLGYGGRSISRSNSQQDSEEAKTKDVTPSNTVSTPTTKGATDNEKRTEVDDKKEKTEEVTQTTFITVVTRGTSPTPPSTTSYVRTRRADLARVIEKTIEKPKKRPQMVDKEIQSERGDNTRLSRYGVSSRWSMYLDRYPSAASSYSPVSRYTSRYGYSSKCDDKETDIKSSVGQTSTESTSTNEAPGSNSSAADINKDIAKDTALSSQKLQTNLSESSERLDNNIRNVKCEVKKPMVKELNAAEAAESKETPSGLSSVGSSKHKDTVCSKSKTVGTEENGKPADCFTKICSTTKEPEIDSSTQVKLAKNIRIKQSAQNNDAMPTSSAQISTVGTSEGTDLVRVKPIKSIQEGEFPSSIKSGNSSSASVSSEGMSDKTSSMGGKKTSDAITVRAGLTKVKSLRNITGKPTQTGAETPVGMKSRSSSVASISSDELSIKTSSAEGSVSKTASDKGSESLGLTRTKSLKNVSAKPPVPSGAETAVRMNSKSLSSASLSSEGATDEASLNDGIPSRSLSEDVSQTNSPSNNEVSISKSSSNEGPLMKTTPSSTSCSKPLPNIPSCKLPPPFPKPDSNAQTLKTCSSLHSLNKFGVANKDFRKSALNVELSSALQAEEFKKLQAKQRHASTSERKFNRSNSMSSGDSDPSCGEGGSTHSLPVKIGNTLNSIRNSKSLSKLYSSSSTSKLPSGTSHKDVNFPKQKSPDTNKSAFNAMKDYCEPSRSHTAEQRHVSSASDTDISSNESSSSSGSSSGDDEDDGHAVKYMNSANLRNSRSPAVLDSQQISVTPVKKVSSSDEMCISVDKPPRPPVSPKPPKTDESKSFLMRALAPVTNLFRGKQENNNLEGLQRASSTQSLNKVDIEVKKLDTVDKCNSQDSISDWSQKSESGSKINCEDGGTKFSNKYKIRKQESGERAWWMASNPNIPEGIKRMESNTSINKLKDVDTDSNKANDIQKVSSNDSLDKQQERGESSGNNEAKINRKSYKISHQKSGELPWYNKGEGQDGVRRIQSNSSTNKLQVDEKSDKSKVAEKISGGISLHQNTVSETDASIIPSGVENTKEKLNRLRHQQSGELPWWLDSSVPIPEGVIRIQSNTSVNKLQDLDAEIKNSNCHTDRSDGVQRTPSNMSLNKSTNSDYDSGNSGTADENVKTKFIRLQHQQSGELPWWLDSSVPVPEGVQRIHSNSSINKLQDSDVDNKTTQGVQRIRSNSSLHKLQNSGTGNRKSAEEEKMEKQVYKIRHQESGELPWWLNNDTSHPELTQRNVSHSDSAVNEPEQKDEDSNRRNFPYKLTHQESGEKAWWLSSTGDVPEGVQRFENNHSLNKCLKSKEVNRDVEESSPSEDSEEEFNEDIVKDKEKTSGNRVPKFPLILPSTASGGKISQSKEEKEIGRRSPYDNIQEPVLKVPRSQVNKSRPKHLPLFIGNHTNIDDILGTAAALVNPVMGLSRLRKKHDRRDEGSSNEEDSGGDISDSEEIHPGQVRIHDSTAKTPQIQRRVNVTDATEARRSSGMIKLDDTALQLYKDGDYGAYLDLEASISEQQEEFDGFQTNRKNSIVLRTQLSVRVHTIIEKLLNSEGRELRRALFSLKQIFQEDKDLVHEFVQNDGLACLIKVGSEADQNYQNYILRALGQVMLYVDGMNGVMEHNETVQWLYALIASKFRLVVKTALKLLLVFVEYVETNCLLLIKAVHAVDSAHGLFPWSKVVKLLKDFDAADTELLIYAMTLVNKTLNGIPDQDTYYDQVDALEEQGIEGTIQRYMSKQGTDLDLLRQFQIYEAVLHHEDGEEKGTPLKQLDETVRKTLRNRKSLTESMMAERRKSRRHSTGTSPLSSSTSGSMRVNNSSLQNSAAVDDDESESSSSRSSPGHELNGSYKESKAGDAGVTPALRRRRERAERQRSFIREQQETAATLKATLGSPNEGVADENQRLCKRLGNGTFDNGDSRSSNKLQQLNRTPSRKDLTPLMNAVNKLQDATSGTETEGNGILKKPWVLSMMYGKNSTEEGTDDTPLVGENEQDDSAATSERKRILQLKRENTVKDLTQKLSSQNIIHSPAEDGNNKSINRIGDMTGLISKAKEGLAKSKSKQDVVKSPTTENIPKMVETKKSETELHWEELVHSMKRPLSLCDLDFTDLRSDDEVDILSPANISNGGPPPPPPVPVAPGMSSSRGTAPPPPPPANRSGAVVPPPMPPSVISPPLFGVNLRSQRSTANSISSTDSSKTPPSTPIKKTKKTVKLFWKEVRDDPIILAKLQQAGMIWDELNPVTVDIQKLEHLFESRAKDLMTKEKQQEMNKNKEIIVLDHKRSNAINIGMTKLPPPRSIKTAILKMDATIMNREGIEKLLTMLPTEEERSKIQEAQVANPDMPLGSAEQFLLTLASITELPARLKLWAFKLDFENSEKEIAEPVMDLKQGMETLKANKTFRGILSTLLSIGIFLNGNEVKGFQIEYLAKVPEVKDTVHKHSLLHHLCHMVMEKFPESSDLYSEIGAVTRASKVDFDELSANILKMEQECKASWDHLKVIAKHDGCAMKVKMSDFLTDCAERIIVLSIVHRRVMNRFHKFLLWLGIPLHRVADTKPNEFCRILSEFSLEYRTTRERVLQQMEKKANHRERNKTRGKMITEVGKFRTKEDRADAELRQLLGSDLSDADSIHGTLPWRRQRKDIGRTVLSPLLRGEMVNGNLTDGDDEILESLVKTATKAPTTRTTPRERKRTRHADRKSLKRSRTRDNNLVEGGRESP